VKFKATLSDDDVKRVFGDLDITINTKGTQEPVMIINYLIVMAILKYFSH